MKSPFARILFAAALVIGLADANVGFAQFTKVVTVVKGTVINEVTGKPISVKVSVRAVGDTATEFTASRSNSESGNYLVVLKPGKKYWFILESPEILTKDSLIETPHSDKYMQVAHDFTVTPLRSEQMGSIGTMIESTPLKKEETEQN